MGKKGKSNHRWIVGGKLCLVLNHLGLITAWDCAMANVHDIHFQPLVTQVEEEMVVFADLGFHAKKGGPPDLKLCRRGQWNQRMLVETVLSMMTQVWHLKKVAHRVWGYFRVLAFTMAAFNLVVQWQGLKPDTQGLVHLSIADVTL